MGQSSSTQREHEEPSRREARRFSSLVRDRDLWTTGEGQQEGRSTNGLLERGGPSNLSGGRRFQPESRTTAPFATFRRQIMAQSTPLRAGSSGTERSPPTHDEVLYEQEERPLVNMEDLRMRDAPITNITASPMPRQPSVMSRLGSRLLPRYTTTGSSSADDEDGSQRRVLRRRLSDSSPPRSADAPESRATQRFSMFGSLSSASSPSPPHSQRRHLAPISSPIPLTADGSVPPSGLPSNSLRASTESPTYNRGTSSGLTSSSRLRLARVRRSISSPLETLENLFTPNQVSNDRQTQTPPRRPSRAPMADETDHLLPPLNIADTSLDLDDHSTGTYENTDHRRTDTFAPATELQDRSPPTWARRWAGRDPSVRRDPRRVPNLLRARSSRLIRRDDEAPLSRILQLAAAAIAAQLAGSPDGITDMESVGDDNLDGSLNTFMQTLNNAAGAATPTQETQVTLAALPPLNFWRVFRFVNSRPESGETGSRPSQSQFARELHGGANNADEDGGDGRTVTLVVVGVRSVPTSSLNREPGDGDTNLDTLLNLPTEPSPAPRIGSGGLLRHANGRSRFTARRRASMGGVNPFPAQYDSQRHQRVNSSSRPASGASTPVTTAAIPMILSESPPGPNPPPSTPADPYLSAQASGTTTPRRPSSSSAAQTPQSSRHEAIETQEENRSTTPPVDHPAQTQHVRQRRRSDSEVARHRDLGAGAARRNGIVEPDRSSRRNGVVEPDDNTPAQGRSWLIYVVGTNLSEDHPAFATPSLFTDNPTYEDMLLLSSLLGPAKPPVASREDVASTLGVYRIRWRNLNGNLHASAIDAPGELQIAPAERCLVCLCEYDIMEDVRQLNKCTHVFHRECIDTWLTTGRNSCPLCRGTGVDEKANARPDPSNGTSGAL